MKRYKLLKDTPTLKAGIIFVEEGDNFNDYKELVQVVPDGCLTGSWFAVSEINNFDDWFEEITEPKRWRAEEGDEYHAINWSGSVHCFRDTRQPEDDYRYKTGNYGRTVEELEAKREYDIARQVLLDDAKGGKFILDSKNWTGYYVYGVNRWLTQIVPQYYPGLIYFRSREALEKSLEEHKEQWETVRKYEMGEM
jgi:hypothetical protein